MSDILITNTSPVVVLAKAGYLHLIEGATDTLLVPGDVVAEILSGPENDPARLALEGGWGQRREVFALRTEVLALHLDKGESSVLSLALDIPGSTVVLDDAAARKAARTLGGPVIGTLGIIIRAKATGRIAEARPVFKALSSVGLYLNEYLLQTVSLSIGESWP